MNKKIAIVCIILALILIILVGVGVKVLFSNPFEKHVKKAVQHMNNGQYQDAVLEFDKAIAIDDKVPEVYYAKANAQIMMGDEEAAKKTVSIAIEITVSGDAKDSDVKTYLIVILDGDNNYISEKELLKWWYDATEGMDEYDDLRAEVAKILGIKHEDNKKNNVFDEDIDLPEDDEENDENDNLNIDDTKKNLPPTGIPKNQNKSKTQKQNTNQSEAWRDAYKAYVKKYGSGAANKLVDLNGDGVPELYVAGESSAAGNKICVFDPSTGTVKEKSVNGGLYYAEGSNKFSTSGGRMDQYHDEVYYIDEDYNVVESEGGTHDDFSYVDPEYEYPQEREHTYNWNGEEVTREEYDAKRNESYDYDNATVITPDNYDITGD